MLKTQAFELVELICALGSTRVNFVDQPQLRSQSGRKVVIDAIELYGPQVVAVSPAGNTIMTIADLKKGFLVLAYDGMEKTNKIPLANLNRMIPDQTTAANYTPGVGSLNEFNVKNVDWTKSYVMFGSATAAAGSVLLGVRYHTEG